MISRKAKLFRVNRGLAADFEETCTLLGIRETNAVEQAVHDWVKKNIGQATLEAFMKTDSRPIVFQNVTLIKMQLNIVKAQFRQALENLERAP